MSGTGIPLQEAGKFFVIKILTSNPLGLKILQSIFVEPAPVKAFREGGGRGYPSHSTFSRNETAAEPSIELLRPTIFLIHFHHT